MVLFNENMRSIGPKYGTAIHNRSVCFRIASYIVFAFFILNCQVVSAEQKLNPPLSVSEPTKGVLLVADHSMPDPRFQQTVILLLEHDDKRGTLGLVLNRPSALTLADALPLPYQDKLLSLGWGGPVSQQSLFMLFRSDAIPKEADPVFADILWSASAKVLKTLLSGGDEDNTIRVFFGVSSWAPSQLNGELEQGGWKLFEAQADAIFYDGDPMELWRHFIDAPTQILASFTLAQSPQHTNPHSLDSGCVAHAITR